MSEFTKAFKHNTRGLEHINPGAAAVCAVCLSDHNISLEGYGCGACHDCCTGHADECSVITEQERIDRAQAALYEFDGDSGFSWSACDTCGSTLGGGRSDAHGFDGELVVHLDVCDDCVAYIANGDEPEAWEG